MNYTTINKLDENSRVSKIDTYATEDEAKERVEELKGMIGYENAYYVSNAETSVGDNYCYTNCHHWIGDSVAKTVTFDSVGMDAERNTIGLQVLRNERDRILRDSDKSVNPDQWEVMSAEDKTKWTDYRQALRDLPSNTADSSNPVWPIKE
jgi:hypothetical protein